jgi:putative ABC transport system permease protein
VPRIENASINAPALMVAIALSMVCGVACGLIPAFSFSRPDLRSSLANVTRTATGNHGRMQARVVVAELAAATAMLAGAGLLARTVFALNRVDTGFAVHETIAIGFGIAPDRVFLSTDDDSTRSAKRVAFFNTLNEQLSAVPGVRGVAQMWPLPLTPARGNNPVFLEGIPDTILAERRFVSANLFGVMGIRIVEGRSFTPEEDRPGAAPAAIISETMARRAWPNQSAIGKRLSYFGGDHRIVGVAADLRDEDLQRHTKDAFYIPQQVAGRVEDTFILRTNGDLRSIVQALRERVRLVHPALTVTLARPMAEFFQDEIASQRYRARLTIVFAVLATLFSIMGVYGVITRNVASRTRELGVRIALGARPQGTLWLIVGQALRLGLLGTLIGTGITLVATRNMANLLYGVRPFDPVTLFGATLLLLSAAALAALPPAIRAARADPVEALRAE